MPADVEPWSAVLKRVGAFSRFSDEEIRALAESAIELELLPGEFLFRAGEDPDRLYVLTRGVVKSVVYTHSGKALTLSLYTPNNVVGEAAFLISSPYSSSCVALTEAQLLGIAAWALAPLISAHPEVPIAAIEILVKRLLLLQTRLENLTDPSAEQRVISVLLYLHGKFGTPFALTKSDIADFAGLTTETVIRTMSGLEKKRIISSRRGWITSLDADELERLREA